MEKLSDGELVRLTQLHGARWCSCVADSIKNLTPQKLSDFCEEQGFRPFPAPIYDRLDNSTRYQYLVDEVFEQIKDTEQHTKVPVIAKFGNFPAFPYNTINSCLEAVRVIAHVLKRDPKSIVEEVVGSDKGEEWTDKNSIEHPS